MKLNFDSENEVYIMISKTPLASQSRCVKLKTFKKKKCSFRFLKCDMSCDGTETDILLHINHHQRDENNLKLRLSNLPFVFPGTKKTTNF